MDLQALVLAAGKSTRFHTDQTKLSYPLCGQSLILYPLKLLAKLNIFTTVVVGHKKEEVKKIIAQASLNDISFCEQTEQRGTGHALISALDQLHADNILVMNGDCPLVTESILKDLLIKHIQSQATITFVSAHNADPSLEGYGRIVETDGTISIVEARDFTGDSATHCCVNAGIYLIKKDTLISYLPELSAYAQSRQRHEIYITDLIEIAQKKGDRVEISMAPFDFIRGVNTMKELWIAEHIKKSELLSFFMNKGVRFTAPQTVHIDADVTIEEGSCIGAGVILLQGTSIGRNCEIEAYACISESILHDRCTVLAHSIIKNSTLLSQSMIGPFAHIRGNSIIGNSAIIGNFVEVNASTIGTASKAKHLSYLGNTKLGAHSNIGAGTITCNYDGKAKHTTHIGNNVFIGSNNCLVAPVTIHDDAVTAAGSVITDDVPEKALAIARARQINKEEYATYLKQKVHAAIPASSNHQDDKS